MKDRLDIRELSIEARTFTKARIILDRVSFEVRSGEIVALVGSSGSGKSSTALAILNLLTPGLSLKGGRVFLNKVDLTALTQECMLEIRGRRIGMVFQEPLEAFNPLFTVGFQLREVMAAHLNLSSRQRKQRLFELLDLVGLRDPKRVAESYPHELSGGMRQRAMIAQAIAGEPGFIIADEPTSNLDVTLQARIMDLFRDLKSRLNVGILLISHDLDMVARLADRINVLDQGKIIESAMTDDLLRRPRQLYTRRLMGYPPTAGDSNGFTSY